MIMTAMKGAASTTAAATAAKSMVKVLMLRIVIFPVPIRRLAMCMSLNLMWRVQAPSQVTAITVAQDFRAPPAVRSARSHPSNERVRPISSKTLEIICNMLFSRIFIAKCNRTRFSWRFRLTSAT